MDIVYEMLLILGTMIFVLILLVIIQKKKETVQQLHNNDVDDVDDDKGNKERDEGEKSSSNKNNNNKEKMSNDKNRSDDDDNVDDDVDTAACSTDSGSCCSRWLPCPMNEPSKYGYERFVLIYTPIWITIFAIVVIFELYEQFDEWGYFFLTGGLALPLLLQPILYPSGGCTMAGGGNNNPDIYRPLMSRYSFKANIWIGVYSFIANYWYTHYFYNVLKAKYTVLPSHRINDVPISMILATHFYFSTYHFFSNAILRKIQTTYQLSIKRTILFCYIIVVFSYFTAFMETFTISAYPYWTFQDRNMAYTIGSAFYAIYFIVSFPSFYYFDHHIDHHHHHIDNTTTTTKNNKKHYYGHGVSIFDTIMSSCGISMIILMLLDFVRLYLQIPLIISTQQQQR